jgi:cyclopropane fatty-acyl-phospholipid synthase-like methyltransferase
MASVTEHYKQLLAHHYTWMSGADFAAKVAEQRALLEQVLRASGIAQPAGLALDLGSGPGFQSVALAELGFSPVVAVDTSAELLEELRTHIGMHAIETRQADLAAIGDLTFGSDAAVAVCMGDTLTHLPSKQAVDSFFTGIHRALATGGLLVITYRDLTSELTGLDRFLPVRSDEEKIMTCFLEYASDDAVLVHDLIHIREGREWKLEKSSYRKLRLAQQWVIDALGRAGFSILKQEPAGRLTLIVARKT